MGKQRPSHEAKVRENNNFQCSNMGMKFFKGPKESQCEAWVRRRYQRILRERMFIIIFFNQSNSYGKTRMIVGGWEEWEQTDSFGGSCSLPGRELW